MVRKLTSKQREVLSFILDFSSRNGYQPSQAEIAKGLGLGTSSVQARLKGMQKKGHLSLSGQVRAITIFRNPDGTPLEPLQRAFRGKPKCQIEEEIKAPAAGIEKIHFQRIEIKAQDCIYSYIESTRDDSKIPVPVPVEEIAELLSLRIEPSAFDLEMDGQLLSEERKILVNAQQHRERQRFTIAHEIGHYVLHSDAGGSFSSVRALGEEEREANYFAARLLMPTETMRLVWEEVSKPLPAQDYDGVVAYMAKHFAVSFATMRICLRELKLLL